MSASSKLLDPLAGVLGVAAGVGSFFLIPGALVAVPAALGIGALVYGAKVAVSSLTGGDKPQARPAVGAGADRNAAPRLKRGSAADIWQTRGTKAIAAMDDLVAGCQQPVIQGQLENVALEARDSIGVLDQLAHQVATIERSLDQMPTSSLRDQRDRLTESLQAPGLAEPLVAEQQRSLDGVSQQQQTVDRLVAVRTGLLARMEATVIGLERLQSEMSETAATATTDAGISDPAGEHHLRDLSDQLAGLRLGLEETRRYTADVLGPEA